VLTVIAVAVIMKQPDMGTTIIVAIIAGSIAVMSGLPAGALLRSGAVAATGAVVLGWIEPYRRERLLSFLDGGANSQGTGYHLRQSLVGLVSGRIFGVGIGASRAKWGFLPNAHTDFIFAIIGEELGLVGCLLVVSLVFGMAVLGLVAARRAPDRFGLLLATGITCWITGQAAINIGAVIGIMPITGVPLPFVSVGGSSLVVVMAATGILLNVARHGVPRSAVVSDDGLDLPRRVSGNAVVQSELRHPAGAMPRPGLRHPAPPPNRGRFSHRTARSAAPVRKRPERRP
jgi:cell division protein FtsW